MQIKTDAIKAQEQIVYNELIKLVELIAATRNDHLDDFVDFANKRPAFMVTAASLSATKEVLLSSHMISPATLHQDHMEPMEMETIARFGIASIVVALAGKAIPWEDLVPIAIEILQTKGGYGHA